MNDLIQNCLKGDPSAQREFIRQTSRVIYSAVLKTLSRRGSSSDPTLTAEDVCQDVYVKLFRENARILKTYDTEKSSLNTWLTIIASRTALDALRKKFVSLLSEGDNRLETQKTIQNHADRIDFPPNLLTERQILILQLSFEQGYEPTEIAKILHVDPQSIRSAKFKAINILREFYNNAENA